jgi:hypothetical protein
MITYQIFGGLLKNVPQEIFDFARERSITIRDEKGNIFEPDDPRQGWSRIYDKNDNMLAQFRTKNDGSVNIDVWMNGVYEDIHFKP